MSSWSGTARVDAGSMIRSLLSAARWRRRYKQSLIATTGAAILAGYFVLLAVMHALDVIDLHDRARVELNDLHSRQSRLQDAQETIHPNPEVVVASIAHLSPTNNSSEGNEQRFLNQLALVLNQQPEIQLTALSWRSIEPVDWSVGKLEALSRLPEMIDSQSILDADAESERIVLLSGQVALTTSQQQASDRLTHFLDALTDADQVIDVIPVTTAFSSNPKMNLPSDVVLSDDDPTAFVIAIRMVS